MASSLPLRNTITLLIILFIFPIAATAQAYSNVTVGTSLTPTGRETSWLSPSGDFAFGFRPLDSDQALFLLAIWFDKTNDKTTVWFADGVNPVTAGYKLDFTADGKLSLKDQVGMEVWKNGDGGNAVAYAAMLDTGNFVLVSSNGSTEWQSFSAPTDTMLPGQTLMLGTDMKSKLTDDDYSSGRFTLRMQDDGNLVLYPKAVPAGTQYDPLWATDTVKNGSNLIFDNSGTVYLALTSGRQISITSSSTPMKDAYQRATLDPDGVFRQYFYDKNGTSWVAVDGVPKDICSARLISQGSGVCGFNSYCGSGNLSERIDCKCPPYYSFIDPSRKYKGCKQDFPPQSCGSNGSDFDFVSITNVDWPLADYELSYPVNESQCRKDCLSDCFCAVTIYKDDGNCWKKKLPLSNGRMQGSVDRKAFIKFSKTNISWNGLPSNSSEFLFPHRNRNDRRTLIVVGSILLGSSFFINLFLIVKLLIVRCFSHGTKRRKLQPAKGMFKTNLQTFTYEELEEATEGFSNEVGRGAFGIVYKGFLQTDSRICVAVKKLDKLFQETEKEFMNEVQSIGQTYHKNLVKLLGFCNEGQERLLVYEFMSNGSLTSYLCNGTKPHWGHRVQVAQDIARGLSYLHEELLAPIIHCDIKSENILLDDNFVARISDFGLAKLLRTDQSRTNTGVRGTKGYVAPEWFKNAGITAKVDVYSFGVLLLEVICCRKNIQKEVDDDEQTILTFWAYDCYKEQRIDLLVDNEEEALLDIKKLERFVTVAIWCIQEDPSLRPPMQKVAQMLEGGIEIPTPPDPWGNDV